VSTQEYTYTVVFEPAEEGGYIATCPALSGLTTQGETLEEARAMAIEAIEGYLEVLREEGRPIPPSETPPAGPVKEKITVQLTAA
jgi:predicted RNase H-like HicB family nuclease